MKHFALTLLCALLLCACKGTEEPVPASTVASIVTYAGTNTANNVSEFSYTDGNGALITLTAAWGGREDVKPGARMLIYYQTEAYGVSTTVTLLSAIPLPGGDPVQVATEADVPASTGLGEPAVWRSGNYLNLHSVIYFEGNASEIALYATAPTGATDELYVVVRTQGDASVTGVERQLYASWNISTLMLRPEATGANVHITDSSNKSQTINIKY